MIPPDVAAQLRQLADVSPLSAQPPVPGLQRARAIQAQLPQLVPGQRFQATLQRTLGDSTFQAVVAGRELTLALTGTAQAGDTLELVVVERRPGLVVARLLGEAPPQTPAPAASPGLHAALSPAARLIGLVLGRQPGVEPTPLAAGQPLLGEGEVTAARLAPALYQALRQSGLFYEAHQAQWLAGQLPTSVLFQEPQGRGGRAPPRAERSAGGPAPGGEGIPDRLLPLVQQQLEALATGHYGCHCQPWTGQDLFWLIDDSGRAATAAATAPRWRTCLRLTLPCLGPVEAELALHATGLQVELRVAEAATADLIHQHHAPLRAALSAVPLGVERVTIRVSAEREPGGEGDDAVPA